MLFLVLQGILNLTANLNNLENDLKGKQMKWKHLKPIN